MRTKIGPDVGYSIEEIHRVLDGPLRLVVTDAEVYWLEDGSGGRLSGEAESSIGPLTRVLELVRGGSDPSDILLCARLQSGARYEIGSGPNLVGVAEAAAGIPARPRTLRQT